MPDDAKTLLARVFERDAALADAIGALLASDQGAVLAALALAAQTGGPESEETDRRLVRIAAIVSDLEGRAAADIALGLLDAQSAVVRAAAGEALLDLAVDGADAVLDAARAVVRRTDLPRASLELPYLLAELGHPRSGEVLAALLGHESAAVVASAIEALVLVGDTSAAPALQKLTKDGRVATIDDEDGDVTVPIAELAQDAISELGGGGKDRARKR